MNPPELQSSRDILPSESDLLRVIRGGVCIGCGACAALHPGLRMELDEAGRYVAAPDGSSSLPPLASGTCPFADGNPNEDELAVEKFGATMAKNSHIGYHVATYAGHVVEGDYRAEGSSGGVATWILCELLERQAVDYVVHIGPREPSGADGRLFEYVISRTANEVRARSKSRYYPVEMSGVLKVMLQQPGRYALVGIPCFIKAVRLACRQTPVLKSRVAFTIGIVCGHLKTTAFAEMCAWQCGIGATDLRRIDFRTKRFGFPANDYAVTVDGFADGKPVSVTKPMTALYGGNWGYGFFKYKACDFCDDVVGETADVSVGDAWLPEYVSDSGGTNIIIVRSLELHLILKEAAVKGRLCLESLSAEKVAASQAGGFRHRREGLAYRLWSAEQKGLWHPPKRVQPSVTHLSRSQKRIFDLRSTLAEASHAAFIAAKRAGDFQVFMQLMTPLTNAYDKLYRPSFLLRVVRKLRRVASRIANAKIQSNPNNRL